MLTFENTTTRATVRRLKKLLVKSPEIAQEAVEMAAAEFMDWTTVGSPRESAKAPYDEGNLRLNVFVRVGNKVIRYKQKGTSGK